MRTDLSANDVAAVSEAEWQSVIDAVLNDGGVALWLLIGGVLILAGIAYFAGHFRHVRYGARRGG